MPSGQLLSIPRSSVLLLEVMTALLRSGERMPLALLRQSAQFFGLTPVWHQYSRRSDTQLSPSNRSRTTADPPWSFSGYYPPHYCTLQATYLFCIPRFNCPRLGATSLDPYYICPVRRLATSRRAYWTYGCRLGSCARAR
jgi:hypothetical protein